MTTIDPCYYLNNQPRGTVGSNLGKDEFLKILMTQLQNQDPLDPMDDSQFIAQMATFSQLEQTMNMSESISKLVKNQSVSPIIQYSHLIGKEVSYYKLNEKTGKIIEPKEIVSGSVMAISQREGYAVLELEGDKKIYTDEIIRINQPSAD
jgi:flagellar basal-body rod modification protein FlgD